MIQSAAIHELEKEINITIFNRTNKGISVSKEGEDFLSYARQMLEQQPYLRTDIRVVMVAGSSTAYRHSIIHLQSTHLLTL